MRWRSALVVTAITTCGLAARAWPQPFEFSRQPGPEVGADVAYNSITDQYLVVWENGGAVWGRIIAGSGEIVREPFIIAGRAPTGGVTYTQPALAFKSPQNAYYVVFLTTDPRAPIPWQTVQLHVLDYFGRLMTARQLAHGPAATLGNPDVAADTYEADDCCVLAVWETVEGSLAGQRLDPAGNLWGDALRVFDRGVRTPAAFHPRIVYQKRLDRFLIVYDRQDSPISSSIALRGLGAVGGLPMPEIPVAALATPVSRPGRPQGHPDLAYNDYHVADSLLRFLVVWRDGERVHKRLLNVVGTPLGPAGPLCSGEPCSVMRNIDQPAVGSRTDAGVFVVIHTGTSPHALRGSVVNATTGIVGEAILTPPALTPAGNAALAWDEGRARFLVVWEEDTPYPFYQDLWANFIGEP